MYKSEVHTPASGRSVGTSAGSLGEPDSVTAMDDFERQLKEKLDKLADDSTIQDSNLEAEQIAHKVAKWNQEIDDILNNEEDKHDENDEEGKDDEGEESDNNEKHDENLPRRDAVK